MVQYTVSLLGKTMALRADHLRCPPTDGKLMLMSWCHIGVGIVIHPDMGIMKVHNTIPCESCLIIKHDARHKLCVYNAFYRAILVLSYYPVKCKTRPCHSSHWFLDVCWPGLFAHLSEYFAPLKPVTLFNTLYINTAYSKM
jgi:hypothetical protein